MTTPSEDEAITATGIRELAASGRLTRRHMDAGKAIITRWLEKSAREEGHPDDHAQ